jgi:hypothetical protein
MTEPRTMLGTATSENDRNQSREPAPRYDVSHNRPIPLGLAQPAPAAELLSERNTGLSLSPRFTARIPMRE